MRGSQAEVTLEDGSVGIIPAHAGLTSLFLDFAAQCRDHPRACGAHHPPRHQLTFFSGSSPRMRGSHTTLFSPKTCKGIIPAHAGLTEGTGYYRDLQWDHPRACGAHRPTLSTMRAISGSSPRMRGSPLTRYIFASSRGIIPAHAGLTHRVRRDGGPRRDHPRACGAHYRFNPVRAVRRGSSPRMRGSLSAISMQYNADGIIPAHAGLTKNDKSSYLYSRDHPRACGAHSMASRM